MSNPSDRRRASQDFKKRYSRMSHEERDELERDSNKSGCFIGLIFLIITFIGILIAYLK